MKKFKNDAIDNYMFWELEKVNQDFTGYCKAMDFKTKLIENLTCVEMPKNQVIHLLNHLGEEGSIVYAPEDEASAFLVPDNINIDLESGTISSDNSFSVYLISNI